YVERFSWYCGTTPGTGVLGTAALFNSDGTLTEVGDRYRSPGAAFTPAGYTWRLVNRADGKALDNYGYTTNGSGVYQYDVGSSPNQRWTITASNGHFKLQCVTGGLCLDTGGLSGNGAGLQQWSSGGSVNQLWDITSVGSGYFVIKSVATGLCLDTGGQTANGAQMQQWGQGGSWNQEWMLIGY
ncbi:MAG TPA: RICIN domain-containing protein, partial [Verrucomicrobiae bacterium]